MTRQPVRSAPRGKKTAEKPPAPSEPRTYRIGEAARMIGVEPFVLRFWETQFPFLRGRHTPSKHRSYGDKEIETLKAIKRLLHKERFTIEGARKHIREHGIDAVVQGIDTPAAPVPPSRTGAQSASEAILRRALSEFRKELISLRSRLH
jgi:DNA-binding transcriptional MerR regulator